MKPSDPGLFFIGSFFFLSDEILFDIGLLMFTKS